MEAGPISLPQTLIHPIEFQRNLGLFPDGQVICRKCALNSIVPCVDFLWTMISEDSLIYQDALEDEAQKTMFRGPLEWTDTGNDTQQ